MTPGQIRQWTSLYACPDRTLAELSGISTGRFSEILSGQRAWGDGEEAKVEATIASLNQLIRETDVAINFREIQRLRDALKKRTEEKASALFLIKKQLRQLGFVEKDGGFKIHILAALQYRSRLSAYTIGQILNGRHSESTDISSLADLCAELLALQERFQACDGLDLEDTTIVRDILSKDFLARSMPAPIFVPQAL
jgi:hypothetical protein